MAGLVRPRTRAEVGMVFTTIRAKVVAVASVTGVAAALTVGLSAASGAAATGYRGGHHVQLDRAFVIVLENHSQKSVIGDPNTPFITSLAHKSACRTNASTSHIVRSIDWLRAGSPLCIAMNCADLRSSDLKNALSHHARRLRVYATG